MSDGIAGLAGGVGFGSRGGAADGDGSSRRVRQDEDPRRDAGGGRGDICREGQVQRRAAQRGRAAGGGAGGLPSGARQRRRVRGAPGAACRRGPSGAQAAGPSVRRGHAPLDGTEHLGSQGRAVHAVLGGRRG
eukprot:3431210-Rhodomonas_salina.1